MHRGKRGLISTSSPSSSHTALALWSTPGTSQNQPEILLNLDFHGFIYLSPMKAKRAKFLHQTFETVLLSADFGIFLRVLLTRRLCSGRFLYRHNSTISLPELYYQINRPDTKSFYVSTLTAYGDTVSGSDEAWVDYLKVCKSFSGSIALIYIACSLATD